MLKSSIKVLDLALLALNQFDVLVNAIVRMVMPEHGYFTAIGITSGSSLAACPVTLRKYLFAIFSAFPLLFSLNVFRLNQQTIVGQGTRSAPKMS